MGAITDVVKGLFQPASEAFAARTSRKEAQDQADAKIKLAKITGDKQVTFNDQELEQLMTKNAATSWRSDYITLTVGGIINLFVLGGILAAFGHSELIIGVTDGVEKLRASGVDIGFIINAVVLAAVGLNIWRKV